MITELPVRPSRFAPVLAEAIRLGRGKPPRTFKQWLSEEVYLPMDGGPHQGKRYQFRFQPITEHWANEIDSGRWNEFVYSGPSQSGKSLSGYVLPMLYHLCELNESVGFGVPMEEMASDKYNADIKPVMESSHRLRRLLPKHGPGSAGGSIRDRFVLSNKAVAKILTAGGSDQAKAGYTLRVILITEAARFSRTAKTSPEADPLEQLRARQRSIKVPDRRTYIDGTNTVVEELPACLYETSSQSRLVSQCPHCGAWVIPGRENLIGWDTARTEIEAAERATWACPKCGEAISPEERREMVSQSRILHGEQQISKRGEITGDLPRTRRLYFSYGAWHNLFLDASDIAVDMWSANQIELGTPARESVERKLCQFVFGTVYTPPVDAYGELLEETDVSERRSTLTRGIAPEDTQHLVAGIDVGERKGCHWVLVAVRANGSLHVVDYGNVEVDKARPIREAVAETLNELFKSLLLGCTREKPDSDGRIRVPVRYVHCDSGHLPEVVFAACRLANEREKSTIFMPILGRGKTQMDARVYSAPTKTGNVIRKIDPDGRWHISKVRRARVDQLTLDADAYKKMSAAGFRTNSGEPGSLTLFAGPGNVHRVFARHQINEQWVIEEIPGEAPLGKWVRTGANDYKDALSYAICGATRVGWSPVVDAIKVKDATVYE
jgi:phage terminase large subunit GpA-like protein